VPARQTGALCGETETFGIQGFSLEGAVVQVV